MSLNFKSIFIAVIGVLLVWLLYKTSGILTPFIVAAVFAFVLDPVVNFFTFRSHLPRTFSVAIVFSIMIAFIAVVGYILAHQIIIESVELRNYFNSIRLATKDQVSIFPDWARPIVNDAVTSVEKSHLLSFQSIFLYFPKAVSQLFNVLIFLFCGFYFLKEGRAIIDRIVLAVPRKNRSEINDLLQDLTTAFGRYLRGQLVLIGFVSLMLFIGLTIIGVPYSLILAIFSGLAEIVPMIGPIFAGTIAAFVVLLRGTTSGLPEFQAAVYVVVFYFTLRQVQDYFVTPYVMGKVTKLHPLIILFAVVAGGHIWGMLGLILAVPLAAMLKIIFDFCMEKINATDQEGTLTSAQHKKS